MDKFLMSALALGAITLLIFPFFVLFITDNLPFTFFLGAPVGFLLGISSLCFAKWNSKSQKFSVPKATHKQTFWFAVGLLLVGRIALELVNISIGILLVSSIIFWIIALIVYFLVQAWASTY